MTGLKPGESAAEILSRLLAEAQRLWGEVRAEELLHRRPGPPRLRAGLSSWRFPFPSPPQAAARRRRTIRTISWAA